MLGIAFILAILTSSAHAQQITPSQMALQINNAIAQMAFASEQKDLQIQSLQAQVKELQDQLRAAIEGGKGSQNK